jgi:uncharacterized protein (TIGR01732 family)
MYYYGQQNPCGCYGNTGNNNGRSGYAYAMILVLFILLVIIGAAKF